jgi:hypothetical protein
MQMSETRKKDASLAIRRNWLKPETRST